MQNNSFLHILAQKTVEQYADKLHTVTLILPNKRAKVFLLDELRKAIPQTAFAPEIVNIEDFVQDIAGLRTIDAIELVFQFYQVYRELTPTDPEPFEVFAGWAKILLQDFNEIDRYLLPPDSILKYLENIKELEHWSVDADSRTDLIENYLKFWKKLPVYYHTLYAHLTAKGIGYQGLIYREAVDNLNHFTNSITNTQYIFAGFNALNQAEERIIQHLISVDKAQIFWDIDETFLNDPFHDAGLFQRKIKATWPFYKTNPYEWISSNFKQEKSIRIIGTPKSIGQAKIVGEIVREKALEKKSLQDVAVVLGDENQLLPVLNSLPAEVKSLNITMGFSAKNNPVQLLVNKLFRMHQYALNKPEKSRIFYYKDVLDVLSNPLLESLLKPHQLVLKVKEYNFTFLTSKKLLELYQEDNPIFHSLFTFWDQPVNEIIATIQTLLLEIKNSLDYDSEEDKITNAFLYAVFKVTVRLQHYFEVMPHDSAATLSNLFAIYKQVIEEAEVSFEGEPLEGLQIMGILESRVLDFETVIITSVNEGKLPAGKTQNSFIPFDVKREKGLPTYKEKDAIYAFHFYHLIQRAKEVYLIYNSDEEGFDASERSRFITQLEIEKQPLHHLTFETRNPVVPTIAYRTFEVVKTEAIMTRLREIAEKGFSPSALTSYIRNPKQFYFQRILRISETEEVEENIAVNTLGTIIHKALEELYKPFVGCFLKEEDIANAYQRIDAVVFQKFRDVYKEGDINKGRNLLAFEVAKRNVTNFLDQERNALQNGDTVQIIALEKRLERRLEHAALPFPVLLGGDVDRIEIRNGKVRIVDYKTGKVEQRNINLSTWDKLTEDLKNEKIIQILAYAWMYENQTEGRELEAGIISFKNMKAGFMPFTLKQDKVLQTTIDNTILEEYMAQIVVLIKEITDETIPFTERV